MKDFFKTIIVFVIGTVVHYLLAVLLLLALQSANVEGLWLTAVPITVLAQVLLLANYIYKNAAKRKREAEQSQSGVNIDG